jgi:hypothetical protein
LLLLLLLTLLLLLLPAGPCSTQVTCMVSLDLHI